MRYAHGGQLARVGHSVSSKESASGWIEEGYHCPVGIQCLHTSKS